VSGELEEEKGTESVPVSFKSFSIRFGVPTAIPTKVLFKYSACSFSLKCCCVRKKSDISAGSEGDTKCESSKVLWQIISQHR